MLPSQYKVYQSAARIEPSVDQPVPSESGRLSGLSSRLSGRLRSGRRRRSLPRRRLCSRCALALLVSGSENDDVLLVGGIKKNSHVPNRLSPKATAVGQPE